MADRDRCAEFDSSAKALREFIRESNAEWVMVAAPPDGLTTALAFSGDLLRLRGLLARASSMIEKRIADGVKSSLVVEDEDLERLGS